jgi:hypothetical protein
MKAVIDIPETTTELIVMLKYKIKPHKMGFKAKIADFIELNKYLRRKELEDAVDSLDIIMEKAEKKPRGNHVDEVTK